MQNEGEVVVVAAAEAQEEKMEGETAVETGGTSLEEEDYGVVSV